MMEWIHSIRHTTRKLSISLFTFLILVLGVLGRNWGRPVVTMLQRSLRTACATIHATSLRVLWAAVDAITRGGRLTLTGLGHTLRSGTSVKPTIKRMDRLLGNAHLSSKRVLIYAAVIQHVLGPRPVQ